MSRFHSAILAALLVMGGALAAAPAVVVISDSTAVDYTLKKSNPIAGTAAWEPMAGWGTYARLSTRPGVVFRNLSAGGHSSKTYVERLLPNARKRFPEGGWLLLSFGSNDARKSASAPGRTTTPEETFPFYMGQIAAAAKEKGMRVVVLSPLPFYHREHGGFSCSVLAPYAAAAKKFADDNGFFFIDVFALMSGRFAAMSDEEVRTNFMFLEPGRYANWPKGRKDPLHYTEKGSKLVWSVIHAEIERNIPELAKLLVPEAR